MSRIICMILCVLCAEVAVTQGMRMRRAASAFASGGSASSSSSGGSYSSGGAGSYLGGSGGNFLFPIGMRMRRAASASASGGGASSSSSSGSYSSAGAGSNLGGGGGNFMFPTASLNAAQAYAAANPAYAQIFHQQVSQLIAQQQAAMSQFPFAFPNGVGVDTNAIDSRFGGNPVAGNPNSVYTASQVSYGPQGGFGQAVSYPGGADGLGTRIAEELPAPSGGTFGTFSSSSSSTSDINGKRTSYKTSTFGTNDNGKITFRTIEE